MDLYMMSRVSNIKKDTINNVICNDPKNQRGSRHCYKIISKATQSTCKGY